MKTLQRQMPLVVTSFPDPTSGHSRRQFCAHACHAASLVAVSALLPGCGGGGGDSNPTAPSGTPSGQALQVLNGSVSGNTVSVTVSGALASSGGAALVSSSLGSFIAFRSSQTSVTVLTAVCTHEGCTVDQFNGSQFVCPCHGSRYTTSGSVANGPATSSLRSFPTTLSGDLLTFAV